MTDDHAALQIGAIMPHPSSNHEIETALASAIGSGSLKSIVIQAGIQWGGFALIGFLYYQIQTSELPAMRASQERVVETLRSADEKRIDALRLADDRRSEAMLKGFEGLRGDIKAVIQTNTTAMENLTKEVKASREQRMGASKPEGN